MNFDEKAQYWDTEERMKRAQMISREIEKVIAGETYHNALEFGCGTGLISFNLLLVIREMTLVDSSEEMIHVVKNKIKNCAVHNISALEVDIVKGDQLPSQYDLIYSSMAMHHVADTKKLLSKLYKHLEKGGRICIVDLTEEDGSFHKEDKEFDGHNGFNLKDLAELFEKTGFIEIESNVFYSGVKAAGDGDVPYSLFLMTAKKKG
jgi:cyclopropane fatty-acyl-phospholipid synthase-like methyltransferase